MTARNLHTAARESANPAPDPALGPVYSGPNACACGGVLLPQGRGALFVRDGRIHGRKQCLPSAQPAGEESK